MFEDSIQKASEYSKAALLRLEFLGLPPTPQNFELLYAYVSGRLPQIKELVDGAVRGSGFTADQARAIYDKHLGADKEKEVLQNNVKQLSEELARVMEVISTVNEGNAQFSETLSGFTTHLNKPLSVDEIRAAVNKVVTETKSIATKNQQLQEQLEKSSAQITVMKEDLTRVQKETLTDSLTGVGNRKHLSNELKRLVTDAEEQKSALSVLMIDIDHFKKFNDTHGHLVGDQVLKLVARTLMENLKGKDCVARYGGEEFVIVLPQTKLMDAQRVADALRMSVSQKKIIRRDTHATLGQVTVSIGVAQYHPHEPLSQFLKRADAGMYLAKAAGRNRVVVQDLDSVTMAKLMDAKGKDADRFDDLDSDDGGTEVAAG
ncbi:MAG: diguanylate cyclase [Alphaproteobacteria bacterium]|nr:diguanylate cyclase [Alphaproteobacteria bacterium]